MLTAFIIGLLAVASLAITVVLVITAIWLVKKVKERLAANKRHKVVFADMEGMVASCVNEQKNKQTEYSMDDLKKMCQDAPYVLADYDIDTGEVLNYTGIRAEEIESDVKDRLKERGGMVVFDS